MSRDHGGGLWTAEDQDGQLYLLVLSYENARIRRELEVSRRIPFEVPPAGVAW